MDENTKPEKKKERPKKAKGKNMGRPKLFQADMVKDAYALSQIFCATYEDLARYWGVNRSTVQRWVQRYPDFCNAIERGRQVSKVGLITSLMAEAKKGNLGAIVFALTNQFPDEWKDRRALVNNVNVNSNRVQNGDSEQLDAPAEVIAKQRALLGRLAKNFKI